MEYLQTKLEEFRRTLERQQQERLVADGLDLELHRHNYCATVKLGKKYANVDLGSSGMYMVTLDTGEIFGIKGYGKIHRGHYYGDLDTINEWDWSPYHAIKRQNINKPQVKETERHDKNLPYPFC